MWEQSNKADAAYYILGLSPNPDPNPNPNPDPERNPNANPNAAYHILDGEILNPSSLESCILNLDFLNIEY